MIRLFGPASERTRIGAPDIEWAVWTAGPDEITERDGEGQPLDLYGALELANRENAISAAERLRTGDDPNSPAPVHAVVLHWGHAWTPETDHSHGIDCGRPDCGACSGPERETGAAS